MSHKHDERKEGIQKIKKDIENTQNNVEFTNNIIESISDPVAKQELELKNKQRLEAIDSMVKDVDSRILD